MSEGEIREEICELGRSIFDRGPTAGSSGHISVSKLFLLLRGHAARPLTDAQIAELAAAFALKV